MAEKKSFSQTVGSQDGLDYFESWRCTRKIKTKNCSARVHKINGTYLPDERTHL